MEDFCVIGIGIVGLSAALNLLQRRPGASPVLVEKEDVLARHQTGHNSGVIHSGIYYEPGSFKAQLCRRGADEVKHVCAEQGIPVLELGKLLVATDQLEVRPLEALVDRARANDVTARWITKDELRAMEPNVVGEAALLIPETASVDYREVSAAMPWVVTALGGRIEFGTEVTHIAETPQAVTVRTRNREVACRQLVVCGGLQADRLARAANVRTDVTIIPFRGEPSGGQ